MLSISNHPEVSSKPFYRRIVSMRSESLPGYRKHKMVKEDCSTVEKGFNKILKDMGLRKDAKERAKALLLLAASKLYEIATTGKLFDETVQSVYKIDFEARDRMRKMLFGVDPTPEELEARANWKSPLSHGVASFDCFDISMGRVRHEVNFSNHSSTMLGLPYHTNEVSLSLNDTHPQATLRYHYPRQTHSVKESEIMTPDQLDGVWQLDMGKGAYALRDATSLDRNYYIYPIFREDYSLLSFRDTVEYLNYRIKNYHC